MPCLVHSESLCLKHHPPNLHHRSSSIQSIVVTDKEGVEIVSGMFTLFDMCIDYYLVPETTLTALDARQNSQILSTIFTLTHEQTEKLNDFGTTEYIIVCECMS
jgi:hypothetical protein